MIFKTKSGRVLKKIPGSGSGSRTRCLDTYPQPLNLANLTLFAKFVETLQKPWNIGSSKTHSQQKGKVETSPRPSGLFLTLHPVSNASSRGNKSKCLVSQINCKYFLFCKIEQTRITAWTANFFVSKKWKENYKLKLSPDQTAEYLK